MLPKPVSTHRRHGFTLRRSFLLNRSRATNLAVLGLVAALTMSLLFNVHLYYSSDASLPNPPMTLLASLLEQRHTSNLSHLIIVPGHAIFTGTDPDLRLRADQWTFQSYQTHQESNLLEVFFKHISHAARLALEDERSLVVFSGGQTQSASTTTEGESYLRLALKAGLFQSDVFDRATSENYALDSFQNLLFSIARFHEYTGSYPEKITVVGYEMKRPRFADLHRTAIRWPESDFDYIGIDPADGDISRARDGERQNGYLPYMADLYGCHNTYLANKRRQRNYAARHPPYYLSCPELRPLLAWCPQLKTQLFSGKLPWSAEQTVMHQRQE